MSFSSKEKGVKVWKQISSSVVIKVDSRIVGFYNIFIGSKISSFKLFASIMHARLQMNFKFYNCHNL
jgi:hypothetical protein